MRCRRKEWNWRGLLNPGMWCLAGVSGGADSVCLLLMLLEYRKHCDFFLEAVHVEHGIRGDASRRDAAFVKRLCEKRGVCCRIYPVDVPAYAKGHGSALRRRRGSSAMSVSGRQQRTMTADR